MFSNLKSRLDKIDKRLENIEPVIEKIQPLVEEYHASKIMKKKIVKNAKYISIIVGCCISVLLLIDKVQNLLK